MQLSFCGHRGSCSFPISWINHKVCVDHTRSQASSEPQAVLTACYFFSEEEKRKKRKKKKMGVGREKAKCRKTGRILFEFGCLMWPVWGNMEANYYHYYYCKVLNICFKKQPASLVKCNQMWRFFFFFLMFLKVFKSQSFPVCLCMVQLVSYLDLVQIRCNFESPSIIWHVIWSKVCLLFPPPRTYTDIFWFILPM